MTRDSEARLLDFCASQSAAVDVHAWRAFDVVRPGEKAVAAWFLGGLDWFGHGEALRRAASAIVPGIAEAFPALVAAERFDLARFSNMLRRRLCHAPVAS